MKSATVPSPNIIKYLPLISTSAAKGCHCGPCIRPRTSKKTIQSCWDESHPATKCNNGWTKADKILSFYIISSTIQIIQFHNILVYNIFHLSRTHPPWIPTGFIPQVKDSLLADASAATSRSQHSSRICGASNKKSLDNLRTTKAPTGDSGDPSNNLSGFKWLVVDPTPEKDSSIWITIPKYVEKFKHVPKHQPDKRFKFKGSTSKKA